MASTAVMIGTVIGNGLLAGAIGDLYVFLKSSAYQEHLEQVLKDLDIRSELDIVEALLEDLTNHTECKTVRVASQQVKSSVESIHLELQEIQQELERHRKRYFNKIRRPHYNKNLNQLKHHRNTLRKRRELLILSLNVQSRILNKPRKNLQSIENTPVDGVKSFLEKLLD